MKSNRYAMIAALALSLSGALATNSALADTPKGEIDVKQMDTDKDGKVSKEEFLSYMGKQFDATAGKKGYCSYEEVKKAVLGKTPLPF